MESSGRRLGSAADQSFGYAETLMYGKYEKDLGDFAKKQAAKIRANEEDVAGFRMYDEGKLAACKRKCLWCRDLVFSKIGEDWIFLTLLGIIMALLSFIMDYAIEKSQDARKWLYYEAKISVVLQYFAWTAFPLLFICFSVGFTHIVGPNAIGSGIPEMKTILRGVILKEYLTFRTMLAKMVGLCAALGSGLPIGKEGPFVHVASIAATMLGKLITSFRGIYENESRNSEMLAAACAVGVACTFAAPIGGVLFSIEVTATYFAVRNYWRGFYSAVIGALVFRLLAIWFKNEETLTALFKTNLRQEFPFDTQELVAFSVIGVVCGFMGALFVYCHRKTVEIIRRQQKLTSFLQRHRFIFPSVVTFVISSLLFPPGLGQFMAGELTNREAINELFSNFTWASGQSGNIADEEVLGHWKGPHGNIYVSLSLFVILRFWMCILAITQPIPSGVFMPVFVIGAAFGRLIGESMAAWFPNGVTSGGVVHRIVPGGYAIVGAAALAGSVTHTISTSVIVFELTGQISHVLPAVISVLIANGVSQALELNIYDSLIVLKKLPYLPSDINKKSINAHQTYVEQFMVREVKYLTMQSTLEDVSHLIQKHAFKAFPIVDNKDSMVLLGSIQRHELEETVEKAIGREQRFKHWLEHNRQQWLEQNKPNTTTDEITVDVVPQRSRFAVQSVNSDNVDVTLTQSNNNGVPNSGATVDLPAELPQMTPEQVLEWECHQLKHPVNFDDLTIDPAPFQLVERTSLYKVHSLFSLLSLSHAYVTNTGRLVGVVSLHEVRQSIQGHLQDDGRQSSPEVENVANEEQGSRSPDIPLDGLTSSA